MHVDVLAFLAIAILLIVMPGPDTAMVTKNALVGGRRSGVLAAVGVTVVRKALDRLTGLVLIGFSVRLALERR